MSNVINVTMFGGKPIFGKGRETKKEVVVSSCEFANSCPALKAGRCSAFNPRMYKCKNHKGETVTGYTSKAAKYHSFIREWKDHEKYEAVENTLKRFEHIGDNKIRISLPHIDVERALAGGSNGYDVVSSKRIEYFNKEEITAESLKRVMEAYSSPLLGGKLENKEEKEEMLLAIKEVDPKLYSDYMKLSGYEINYVGKNAYLKTIKPNTKLTGDWFWDGTYMKKDKRTDVDCFAIKGLAKGTQVSFIPEDDALIEIKDVSWIVDTTKFEN